MSANPDVVKLIPALAEKSAIERKYVKQILRADPGVGEKSLAIAESLADSGFTPAAAAMIIQSVYSSEIALNRGRGTRIKWFTQMVHNRYGSRLDKIKSDYKAMRAFLADIEEINEMRDALNIEGYGLSYEAAGMLWELGEDANSIMTMITNHCGYLCGYLSSQMSMVVKAAVAVKHGRFSEVETALEYMCRHTIKPDDDEEHIKQYRPDSE
jgi:hypothetical protein